VSQSPTSGWLLVFVHWFIGGFVWACQPWRVMTLGFGKWRVPNALNKVEALGAFLQGLAPCLAMAFPVERDADGNVRENLTFDVITALLTALITGLLSIRVVVFTAERLAVRGKKMDMESDPKTSIENVRAELIALATSGAVVRLYAFKADVDVKRRKTLARLEDTRHAMLARIDDLKTFASTSPSEVDRAELVQRVVALYEVANEMASIVNAILPKPLPEDANAEAQIHDVESYARRLVDEETTRHARVVRDGGSPTASAEHVALLAHAYDRAMARLDEHMAAYAAAESLANLVALSRAHRALRERQRAIAIGFGDEETTDAMRRAGGAEHVGAALRVAREFEDAERTADALANAHAILRAHEAWRRAQASVFTTLANETASLEDASNRDGSSLGPLARLKTMARSRRRLTLETSADADVVSAWPSVIPRQPRLTTDGVCDVALASLAANATRVDAFARERASTWASTFRDFGRLRYARAFAEQTRRQLAVDVGGATSAEDAQRVFDEVFALSKEYATWCDASARALTRLTTEDASFATRFGVVVSAATASLKSVREDAVAQGARVTNAR